MSLEQEIVSWDGKSSNDIDVIYNRYCDEDSFGSKMIDFSRKVELQKGATWLLKRYLEDGQTIEARKCAALFKLLTKIEHWESKLHILQCLPYMQIGKTTKKDVDVFLRKCLIDDNKFVRAWAYNGFYEISLQYPEYKEETKQFFDMAMRDEAPSVKARVRSIVKKGF